MSPLTASAVLDALDAAAARLDFPVLDNMNIDYISSRLQVYRGGEDWAVVFNSIAWANQSITTIVEPIGSAVRYTRTSEMSQQIYADDPAIRQMREKFERMQKQGFLRSIFTAFSLTRDQEEWMRTGAADKTAADAERAREEAMAAGVTEDHKFMGPGEIEIDYAADGTTTVRSVSVRGRAVPLASLTLRPQRELHSDEGFWIAVALAEQHRDELLATPSEIARFFPNGLPPEFLVLDAWRHVDLSADEKPSRSETFQMLASAIARGDPSLYKPTGEPNTHWLNWLPK